jgi:hypothetical protein
MTHSCGIGSKSHFVMMSSSLPHPQMKQLEMTFNDRLPKR